MGARKGEKHFFQHTCPVCKEKFYPAPEHVYKTRPRGKFICSWHCLVKYRKEIERKKREAKRKKKNESN